MRTNYKSLLLIVMCAGLQACRLDPPVFPETVQNITAKGATGATGATGVTGTTGATGTDTSTPISNPELTGVWTFKGDYTELFDLNYNITRELSQGIGFYKTVQLDDSRHTAIFSDPAPTISDSYNYMFTKESGKSFLQFSSDPFFRSGNYRVEIAAQPAGSMTWIIIDPKTIDIDGGLKGYAGHKIFLAK